MNKVYVIVGKGYSNYLSCNKVFETQGLAQLWLNSYCNPSKFEVVALTYHQAPKKLTRNLEALVAVPVADLFMLVAD